MKEGGKMKKTIKSILALSMTILLLMSFVSCNKMTAQELFEKSRQNMVGSENQELALKVNAIKDEQTKSGLEMSMKMVSPEELSLDVALKNQGMTMEGEAYIKDKVILVHAPMLAMFSGGKEYMKLDLNDIPETEEMDVPENFDRKEILALIDKYNQKNEKSFYDFILIDEEMKKEEIKINEETIKVDKVTGKVDVAKAFFYFNDFMKYISENPDFIDENIEDENLAEVIKNYANEYKENMPTDEEIDEAVAQMGENAVKFESFIDKKMNMVRFSAKYEADIPAEGTYKFDVTVDSFNFNKVESIEMPEVAPENIFDASEAAPSIGF